MDFEKDESNCDVLLLGGYFGFEDSLQFGARHATT